MLHLGLDSFPEIGCSLVDRARDPWSRGQISRPSEHRRADRLDNVDRQPLEVEG